MTNQTPESVIDDSMVEAAYRAFCEARFGKALSDDEHDALRSRLELTWIKPTIAAALRAANMLREPAVPDAATELRAERDAALKAANAVAAVTPEPEWGVRHVEADGWVDVQEHESEVSAREDSARCGMNCSLVRRVTKWEVVS